MITIGRAYPHDLDDVLGILNSAAGQLHSRGLDQWSTGFTAERIGPYIACAEMWLLRDETGRAVATVRGTSDADPDFWTPEESRELAMYVSKLARAPHAAPGIGTMLLRWLTDHAASLGYAWIRLDAWRTNPGLHHYYADRGWTHVRTVNAPGRRSGALFQRSADPDPAARAAFRPRPAVTGPWIEPGTRVLVTRGLQQEAGTITGVWSRDPMHDEVLLLGGDEFPARGYWVQIDGQDAPIECGLWEVISQGVR
jgi:GNAT superfamily N-acetyltransferase